MRKSASFDHGEARSEDFVGAKYSYAKTLITIAKKNGLDLEGLDLVPRDLPPVRDESLSKKEIAERNRLVKNIFQRFSNILTPPIPRDLEKSIKSKEPNNWLPWEKEAMEKITLWRNELATTRPEILHELSLALRMTAGA